MEKSEIKKMIIEAENLISNLNNDRLMSAYINANHIWKSARKLTPKICNKETYCSTCKYRQKRDILNFLVSRKELKCFHENALNSHTDRLDGKTTSWYSSCWVKMPDNGLCSLWEEK